MANSRKKLTSWIFVYAALVAAVVFASQSGAAAPRQIGSNGDGNVSPVVLGGDAPALAVDPVVRRFDL